MKAVLDLNLLFSSLSMLSAIQISGAFPVTYNISRTHDNHGVSMVDSKNSVGISSESLLGYGQPKLLKRRVTSLPSI